MTPRANLNPLSDAHISLALHSREDVFHNVSTEMAAKSVEVTAQYRSSYMNKIPV